MSFSTDPFPSYKLIADELLSRGYTLTTDGEGRRLTATYTSPQGNQWTTKVPRIRYPFTSGDVQQLFDSKALAYNFVSSKGVPVPFTKQLGIEDEIDIAEAEQLIEKYKPLVVKPDDSSSSKGLMLNITNTQQLQIALSNARAVKKSNVLIQQQVDGEEIRFLVAEGEVVAALLRQTPRVIGDGLHSVKELLAIENEQRRSLVFPYISYPQLSSSIIDAAFFSDERILTEGETLELSRATMIRNGCSVYEVLSEVHPSYIQHIKELSKDLDSAFYVVDFLVKDYRTEARPDNYWFLEFNTSPALKLCYGCRDGKMFNAIPLIADLIDKSIN